MPLLRIIRINTNHNHSKKLIITENSCYFRLPTTCNEKKSFPSKFRVKNKEFLLINATFWNLVNLRKWYQSRQNFSTENPNFSMLRVWFFLKPSNLHAALDQQCYIQSFQSANHTVSLPLLETELSLTSAGESCSAFGVTAPQLTFCGAATWQHGTHRGNCTNTVPLVTAFDKTLMPNRTKNKYTFCFVYRSSASLWETGLCV